MRLKFGTIAKYCEHCDKACDSPKSVNISVWVDTTINKNGIKSDYVMGEFALCEDCATKLIGGK